nr:MAG TPA: hypothetical protein [Caudoviricetes sp.]
MYMIMMMSIESPPDSKATQLCCVIMRRLVIREWFIGWR